MITISKINSTPPPLAMPIHWPRVMLKYQGSASRELDRRLTRRVLEVASPTGAGSMRRESRRRAGLVREELFLRAGAGLTREELFLRAGARLAPVFLRAAVLLEVSLRAARCAALLRAGGAGGAAGGAGGGSGCLWTAGITAEEGRG